MKNLLVRNLESINGNKVANQFVIDYDRTRAFQSYESLIFSYDYNTKTLFIGRDYDYSNTTRKYANMFLREYLDFYELNTKELRRLEKERATTYTLSNGLVINLEWEG